MKRGLLLAPSSIWLGTLVVCILGQDQFPGQLPECTYNTSVPPSETEIGQPATQGDFEVLGHTVAEDIQECLQDCCNIEKCNFSAFVAIAEDDDSQEDNCFSLTCNPPGPCIVDGVEGYYTSVVHRPALKNDDSQGGGTPHQETSEVSPAKNDEGGDSLVTPQSGETTEEDDDSAEEVTQLGTDFGTQEPDEERTSGPPSPPPSSDSPAETGTPTGQSAPSPTESTPLPTTPGPSTSPTPPGEPFTTPRGTTPATPSLPAGTPSHWPSTGQASTRSTAARKEGEPTESSTASASTITSRITTTTTTTRPVTKYHTGHTSKPTTSPTKRTATPVAKHTPTAPQKMPSTPTTTSEAQSHGGAATAGISAHTAPSLAASGAVTFNTSLGEADSVKISSGVLVMTSCFGVILFCAMMVLLGKKCFDSWQRRDYSKLDYLINGMYS